MDDIKLNSYAKSIKDTTGVFIKIEKLKKIIDYSSQVELKRVIDQLIEMEVISAAPKAAKTYEIPQVPKKYRIQRESETEILEEIKFKYNPRLNLDHYKKHTDDYLQAKKNLEFLSQFFYEKADKGVVEMSLNERSLCVFKHEKYLSSKAGKALLTRTKTDIEELNIYRTPEPFFYYVNKGSTSNKVLIIENKDTWYTIRRNVRNGRSILGYDFRAIIYGEGTKIHSSFEGIDYEEYEEFNDPKNEFYYFGDIDAYGINIFKSLQEKYPGYRIIPFIKAYRYLLLSKHTERTKEERMNCAAIKHSYIAKAFDELTAEEQELLCAVCNRNDILPQELLNNQVLLEEK